MKKILWIFCMAGMMVFILAGCSGSAQKGQQDGDASAGDGSAGGIEGGVGVSSIVSIKDAYYYSLLENDAGDIVAFANASSGIASEDAPAVAWKSSDRGGTWEELLYQPEGLQDGCELQAGTLRVGEEGLEAFAVFSEPAEEAEERVSRLFRITENACEEFEAGEAFEQLGDAVWNVSFVNGHVVSLAGAEQCVLYDTKQQKAVKSLSYNSYEVGFLPMTKQFIVYGKKIVHCLNAETLEEEEADKSLQEFFAAMYQENGDEVFPPMCTYKDTIVCLTTEAVYEYKEGKTVRALSVPEMLNGGKCFNGMFPLCKGRDNAYYTSAIVEKQIDLIRIEEDKETEKDVFSIYSLTQNECLSQIARLFQQENPELKVEIRVGMEGEAALTRTDAIKQLNTEMMAGGGPDIVIMDGLSVEKYVGMGLLHPIKLEQKEGRCFKNIIETYQKDGALYALPIGFWLYAVQGTADVAFKDASPEGVCQWVLANADKAGLEGYEYTYGFHAYAQFTQFLYDVYANSMVKDGAADRNVLKAYMDSCGKLAEGSGQSLTEEECFTSSILSGAVEVHYNEGVEISAGMVMNATDLAALNIERRNGAAEYSLYPMYQPCGIIAVNANTKQDAIAQKFAAFSLGDSAQKISANYFQPVVVERFHDIAQKGEAGEELDSILTEISLDGEEESFMVCRPTEGEAASMEQEVEGIGNVFTDDAVLRDIVMESLLSYLSKTVTLDDAVSSAENRINLYLGE